MNSAIVEPASNACATPLDLHVDHMLTSPGFRGGLVLMHGVCRGTAEDAMVVQHALVTEFARDLERRITRITGSAATLWRQAAGRFVLALHGAAGARVIAEVADLLHTVIATLSRAAAGGRVGSAFGIACYPDDGLNSTQLELAAASALNAALRDAGNGFRFANEAVDSRFEGSRELRAALRNGELALHYQAIMSLRSGRCIGAEALIRWRGADGSMKPASSVIKTAERSSLIIDIDRWALHRACRDALLWHHAGHPLRVNVNVSALHFRQKTLIGEVADALHVTGLPPETLEVEVTETAALQDAHHAATVITTLRGMGVRVALDDFGTGYSSLAQLRLLHVDTLKIDRSFVSGCVQSARDRAIVFAVSGLAHRLGMTVVAEGLESSAHERTVREHCDLGQGFMYSRPLPAADFMAWLEASRQLTRLARRRTAA